MYKVILFSTLLAALVLVIPGRASAQVERFQGQWKSTNRNAHYLVKLDITVHGGDVEASAWSASLEPFEIHCARFSATGTCKDWRQSIKGPFHLGFFRAEIYATSDSDDVTGKASALLLRYSNWLVILETQGSKLSATVFSQGHVEHDLFKH